MYRNCGLELSVKCVRSHVCHTCAYTDYAFSGLLLCQHYPVLTDKGASNFSAVPMPSLQELYPTGGFPDLSPERKGGTMQAEALAMGQNGVMQHMYNNR